MQQLKHANIIELIEYYKFDTHFYLIFEYMENGSLKDTLNKFGKFPESLIVYFPLYYLFIFNYLFILFIYFNFTISFQYY